MSELEQAIQKMVREVIAEEIQSAPRLPRPLLTADQAGELLQLDKQSVYRLAREGALKPVYISQTRFRFQVEEIERFIRDGGARKSCLKEVPQSKVRGGGAR
jgi:predicted DNA-binding transcriptional regulator AlpA